MKFISDQQDLSTERKHFDPLLIVPDGQLRMKTLIIFTCVAIVSVVGQHFWSDHPDVKFQKAIAEITASEEP